MELHPIRCQDCCMRNQRGLAPSVEAVVIIPGLVLLVGLVVVLARVAIAQHDVTAVAGDAARAVSIARSGAQARAEVPAVVETQLRAHGVECARKHVAIDAAGLRAPLGSSSTVSVTVECALAMSDVLLPKIPGTISVRARVESPVDKYRGR